MAINRTAPLDERIINILAETNEAIDREFVEPTAKANPGVPFLNIRMMMVRGEDVCSAYLRLKADEARAAA
jgi:hypothetical protein